MFLVDLFHLQRLVIWNIADVYIRGLRISYYAILCVIIVYDVIRLLT